MQAVADLLVDRIKVSFDVMPTTIEYARTGKLRALAVKTATRSPALPDIPTLGDFVPSYEASSWHGVGVPKKHARGDRREAQQRDQCRPHLAAFVRSKAPGAVRYHADTATCGIN